MFGVNLINLLIFTKHRSALLLLLFFWVFPPFFLHAKCAEFMALVSDAFSVGLVSTSVVIAVVIFRTKIDDS